MGSENDFVPMFILKISLNSDAIALLID